ncbi:MAG: type II toxin-antitoxin system PemK/MazF family toxin [Candidatus Limnocylindria bacterium]
MARATLHGELVWASVDKRRPVVVVSRDDGRGVRQRATVATITTRVRSLPTEVPLDQADGMEVPCVVNCDDLATLNKSRLGERIGRLSGARLDALHRSLAFALALPGPD